ncbi:MAG: NAD(P)-binding protein [Proteobacteria bacterium]|nr:NAD(P)-binding protein [Pseudomonadota bacterium]
MPDKKILIIGAGPAGSTSARIFAEAGWTVDIFEKRHHIAGNCYDELDENGVLVHRYGPHYFRSNQIELLKWLGKFTDWIPGRYYVRAKVKNALIPVPISLATITALKGKAYSAEAFEKYLQHERISFSSPQNAEEQCLAQVGRELYETLFKGYTSKQWGVEPTKLSPDITARIPLRFDWDERYASEKYQVMPKDGYTAMFHKMLEHSNINVELNSLLCPSDIKRRREEYDYTFYSGPVDTFFDLKHGKLGYRSLRFEWHYYNESYVQPCVQINYPNDFEYTRTVEAKHVTAQKCDGTTVSHEYPQAEGEPFYPLLTRENLERYAKYRILADKESNSDRPIIFLGRLAEFKYYNMDHVILWAMETANRILRHEQGRI